jgi:hypothetical protein
MSQVLARNVCACGAHVVPGQRLDEVAAAPLEYRAVIQVDTATGFGFRVSYERHQPALRSQTGDDVHMIREDGHLVDVYLPARRSLTNGGAHDIGVCAAE